MIKEDFGDVDIYYIITMLTKNGKKLYLQCGNNNKMDWSFSKTDACWFENYKQAEKFAQGYFKNFNNWYIEGVC